MLLALAAAAALAAAPTAASTKPPNLARTIREARFIFRGTIEQLGASNLALLPASRATALVLVREVIDQPATMDGSAGIVVTVVLADADGAQPGGQAIFFTRPWLFGENVAVREVARTADPTDPGALDELRRQVAAVRAEVADDALAARLSSAVLVVSGSAGEPRPLPNQFDEGEHAAEWAQTEIAVATTEKGQAGASVTVYFATSGEGPWRQAPAPRAGDAGIYLLQPFAADNLPPGALVLLNPLDVQPLSQLDRVRRLLLQVAGPRR